MHQTNVHCIDLVQQAMNKIKQTNKNKSKWNLSTVKQEAMK